MTLKEVLDAAGRAHVLDVLASTGGNITEAAKVDP